MCRENKHLSASRVKMPADGLNRERVGRTLQSQGKGGRDWKKGTEAPRCCGKGVALKGRPSELLGARSL